LVGSEVGTDAARNRTRALHIVAHHNNV
jgi:hypothetical protein